MLITAIKPILSIHIHDHDKRKKNMNNPYSNTIKQLKKRTYFFQQEKKKQQNIYI